MKVVSCPGCGVRIKVEEGKHGRFACPKCSHALLIKPPVAPAGGPAAAQPPAPPPPAPVSPLANPLTNPLAMPQFPIPSNPPSIGAPPWNPTAGVGGSPHPPKPATWRGRASSDQTLKGFLIRLALAHAIIAGVLLLLTLAGLFSEPLAMGASVVAILCALGLLFGGRIWMIVIAFQEATVQGLLVLLVPYYWLIYMITRKGRTIKAFAVLVSTLIPALLALGMVAVFMARYEGGSPRARSSPFLPPTRAPQARNPLPDTQIATPALPPPVVVAPIEPVLQTVAFPLFGPGQVDLAAAEKVLNTVSGYVAGSVRADAEQGVITLQYRGSEASATQYGLALSSRAGIMLRVKPTFLTEAAGDP
ncbi:MAG: hypothetical protein AB7O62_13775 [Pirellulales bacterium]